VQIADAIFINNTSFAADDFAPSLIILHTTYKLHNILKQQNNTRNIDPKLSFGTLKSSFPSPPAAAICICLDKKMNIDIKYDKDGLIIIPVIIILFDLSDDE
jgi:hypothetical protein